MLWIMLESVGDLYWIFVSLVAGGLDAWSFTPIHIQQHIKPLREHLLQSALLMHRVPSLEKRTSTPVERNVLLMNVGISVEKIIRRKIIRRTALFILAAAAGEFHAEIQTLFRLQNYPTTPPPSTRTQPCTGQSTSALHTKRKWPFFLHLQSHKQEALAAHFGSQPC